MKRCKVQECMTQATVKGFCAKHYRRFVVHGDPSVVKQVHEKQKSKCVVIGCTGKPTAHSLCSKHYRKKLRYGDPTVSKQLQYHGLTLEERFWKYTVKKEGCWEWVGNCDPNGYGRLSAGNWDGKRKPMLAHRISYMIHNGGIISGKHVLHKCDNPNCVNPEHLYSGTPQDNVDDMWDRGRANPGRSVGENHGMAKLSEDQVREIRKSNETGQSLAEKHGISASQVSAIKNRKAWKHLILPGSKL